MNILIVGAGVSGLSCGIRLCEAGHRVRVWARELTPDTTSDVAAALWYPYKAYPEHLVAQWGAATFAELARLAGDPATGVVMRRGLDLFRDPQPDPWWAGAVPSFRRATPEELPPGFADGFALEVPIIEMPVYLPYLLGRLRALGGVVERRAVHSLDEALAEEGADAVVNCAGLGARELAGDRAMIPIRGQVVRVAQVGVEQFTLDEYNPDGICYIVPRSRDIILGGTADEGREDTTPDPATAEAIVARCAALEPRLRGAAILGHRVGLRPGRPEVRLVAERTATGKLLAHNYGHGGAGVTLSWGCAEAVLSMVSAS